GVYEITTRENLEAGLPLGIMLCEGVGMLADRIKALRTANIYEAQTYVHITARPQIWEEGRDCYGLRSNFTVYRTMYTGAVELFALGKYQDLISVADGEPRFLKRQVVLDPRRIDTLLVIPL
ncbi:MAG: aromatic-ring-hydroxylating dioxygenase subunit beta, partial [Lacisediminimonas sp.]|nr:aromatic-ring-hydroxylating dioxygenase subunit beta [Lacisediminimonas sp.]